MKTNECLQIPAFIGTTPQQIFYGRACFSLIKRRTLFDFSIYLLLRSGGDILGAGKWNALGSSSCGGEGSCYVWGRAGGGRRKININMLSQLRKAILTKNLILWEFFLQMRVEGGSAGLHKPILFKYPIFLLHFFHKLWTRGWGSPSYNFLFLTKIKFLLLKDGFYCVIFFKEKLNDNLGERAAMCEGELGGRREINIKDASSTYVWLIHLILLSFSQLCLGARRHFQSGSGLKSSNPGLS